MRLASALLTFFCLASTARAQGPSPGSDLAKAVNAPLVSYSRNEKATETVAAFEERLAPFYHGVASGDPMTDRVIIWTRVTPQSEQSIDVYWRVATDAALKNIVQSGVFTTDNSRDYTVKVDVLGLQPNTTYYYGFTARGKNSITGRTKTAPLTTDRLRFAVVSCSNYQAGFFNAYGRIADRNDLDAVVHLGDYIYEYPHGGYGYSDGVGRGHEPKNEAITHADYRIRYSFYKLDPDLRRIHQQHPFIAVWDDHETANNAYKDGASNHQPSTEGDWELRKSAARKAYHEWMPVREQNERVYRVLRYGDLADLIILDTRLEGRMMQLDSITNPAFDDPNRTMLGLTQREWLLDQLKNSKAKWKILGNQTMFVQLRALEPLMDPWDGYPAERMKIMEFIKSNQLSNVIVATGDIHTSWANDIATDPYTSSIYNPNNGNGSLGVEFITPSITAANFNETTTQSSETAQGLLKLLNPHVKFIELNNHGYYLLDLTADRAQADWYHVDTILIRSEGEKFAQGARVADKANRLTLVSSPVAPRENAPEPAPEDPPTELPSSVNNGEDVLEGIMIVGSYPNPAVTHTSLHYVISKPMKLAIKLFTSEGMHITTLLEGDQHPGVYALSVATENLAAGSYLYVVETAAGSSTRKLVVQK